jgi:hypothetical protein
MLADIISHHVILCRNVLSHDKTHYAAINEYIDQLAGACISAISDAIPLTCAREARRVPGRFEFVEPVHQSAL